MPPIRRRQFLQSAGVALATLGFSQLQLQHHALNYANVLAQSTPRKRALLVGISDYVAIREGSGWAALPGAVNDVAMQRELLVHRFGFQPGDVRLLTNREATRQTILAEFEDLIYWAQPGDVVVFHFSGHGSTVDDPDRIFDDHLNGTLVSWDSELPPGGGTVDDITSGTLFLLMAALKTEYVTVVLDSCYSGGGTRGNLIMRSRPGQAELLLRGGGAMLSASPEEKAYQERWLKKLNWSKEDWLQKRRTGLAKGAALLAARRDQSAADATFAGDTHAGVFSYALTRYLWQQTRNAGMGTVFSETKRKTDRLLKLIDQKSATQIPEFQTKPDLNYDNQPTYFLSDFLPAQKQAAEAVITAVTGNQVEVLLNGVEPQVLETFGKGATLTLIDRQGQPIGTVAITDRQQLSARGTITATMASTIAPGALLQERSRIIPPDWTLRIGLDPSLGKDAAIAKAELPKLQVRIEPVPLLQQEVHYILGRVTEAYHQAFQVAVQQRRISEVPTLGSITLFSPSLEPLPSASGTAGETITAAIERLRPKFKFLLAARLLKLTLNTTSSRLQVQAAVRVADARELAAQAVAVRGGSLVTQAAIVPGPNQIRAGQQIQIVVQNQEPQELYFAVVLLSVDGEVEPLPFGPTQITPGQKIVLPDASRSESPITIGRPLGVAEVMVVFSTTPLEEAIAQLRLLSETRGDDRADRTMATIDTLLDDLGGTRTSSNQPRDRRLSPEQMAALSVTFEIIE